MIAAFLITLRETVEASLIVALVLGMLTQYGQQKAVKSVWAAVLSALGVSLALLLTGTVTGVALQTLYTGHIEAATEGILFILSTVFITWTVFFLHAHFSGHKHALLAKIRTTIEKQEETGIFWLTFTAVLREGIEIVIFLSTIFLASKPQPILLGSLGGLIGGLGIACMLFLFASKEPVSLVFRIANSLLIVFAGGMLARGIHELTEIGLIPKVMDIRLPFLPSSQSIGGTMLHSLLGVSPQMEITAVACALLYIGGMSWWLFVRPIIKRPVVAVEAKN